MVGIGAATVDIISLVDRFPDGDSVQEAHSHVISGGGPVATALCAASKLGVRTALVDSVGNDWVGMRILDDLRSLGVCTSFVGVSPGASSSLSTILVRRTDATRAIAFKAGTAPPPLISPQVAEAIASARVLHMNGRHPDACRAAVTVAQQHRTLISFDGGASRYRAEIADLVAAANILIVSRDFAEAATGIADSKSAVVDLASRYSAEIAVVTDGSRGSWLVIAGGGPTHFPAFKMRETVDTTGAGDVFHGAFVASYISRGSASHAQRFATAAAAISTTAMGGRHAIPAATALEELLSVDSKTSA